MYCLRSPIRTIRVVGYQKLPISLRILPLSIPIAVTTDSLTSLILRSASLKGNFAAGGLFGWLLQVPCKLFGEISPVPSRIRYALGRARVRVLCPAAGLHLVCGILLRTKVLRGFLA